MKESDRVLIVKSNTTYLKWLKKARYTELIVVDELNG